MVEKCFLRDVSVVFRNVILYCHNSTFYGYKRCIYANELVVLQCISSYTHVNVVDSAHEIDEGASESDGYDNKLYMPIINETIRVDICLKDSTIIVRIVARVFVANIDQRGL